MSDTCSDFVAIDENDAMTRSCRRRALQGASEGMAPAQPIREAAAASGQEAILLALDWSLRVAARLHSAAIGAS
jgi:hypothetical protein